MLFVRNLLKFNRNFLKEFERLQKEREEAFQEFYNEVQSGRFPEKKHMVGGWQWEGEKVKKLMLKKSLLKTFLKIIIPFKRLRKKIRQHIYNKKTVKVEKISLEDKEMLQDFYREDIKKLSELLNRNLNFWRE